jgi:glycolate oxidase
MEKQSRYSKVTDEVVKLLTEIVGEKNIVRGEGMQDYSHDEAPHAVPYLPEVVVKPDSVDAITKILKLANDKIIPVTPCGARTGLVGGATPIYGGIVLSLERMTRVLEIDDANFTATVEPGLTLANFYQALAKHGFYYPVHPGETSATIGGTVATNAGGMRAVKYGVTRQSVLGLEALLPTGELIKTGGKFVKCSTAYDLTQLITGSEGTLAVITSITLKVAASPGRIDLLFIPFRNLHDAIHTVPDIFKSGIIPVGIEFMDKDIITLSEKFTQREMPMHEHEAFLMIFLESRDEEEFFRLAEQVDAVCRKHNAVDIYIPNTDAAKQNLIDSREKFYPACQHFGMMDMADVVVPRSRIADFVEEVKKIGGKYGVRIVILGHAGDGNVHIHPMRPDSVIDEKTVKEIMAEIYKVGLAMGGNISGEHGVGFAKKRYLPLIMEQSKLELMKRIKLAFDPNNILNPGKIFDV